MVSYCQQDGLRIAPTVIPGVVIHKCRPIRHPSDLVSVVPPTHHDRILLRVLSQPIIRLPEIVDDMLASVLIPRSQHNRRGRIGIASDPRTVQNEEDEEEDRNANDDESAVQPSNAGGLVLFQDGTEDLESRGGTLGGSLFGGFGDRGFVLLGLLGGHFGACGAGDGDGSGLGGRRVRHPWINVGVQDRRKCNGGSDTNTRSESQHQPNHDAGEVGSYEGVDDDEHMLVPELPEAKDDTRWEEEHEEMKIHEERWPGSRLVLRNGCDDWDISKTHLVSNREWEPPKVSLYFLAYPVSQRE